MLAWSDDYKIGHPELDAQHLMLFALINQLDINIATGKADHLLTDVMGALWCYIDYHFTSEEAVMRAAGFPGAARHRDGHQGLIAKVERLAAELPHVADPLGHALKTRKFIIDWLVDHILAEDAGFAAFAAEKKVLLTAS